MSDVTADRVALRYLVEAYAMGCDTRDATLLGSCFADDSTMTVQWLDREPSTMRMPDDAERIAVRLERYERTLHFVGNHRAEIDGDRATGETYCFAHHISDGNDHVMAIRYHDVYQRDAGGWKITERTLKLEWTQDAPVTD